MLFTPTSHVSQSAIVALIINSPRKKSTGWKNIGRGMGEWERVLPSDGWPDATHAKIDILYSPLLWFRRTSRQNVMVSVLADVRIRKCVAVTYQVQ
jgi:hypothetical protein